MQMQTGMKNKSRFIVWIVIYEVYGSNARTLLYKTYVYSLIDCAVGFMSIEPIRIIQGTYVKNMG